MGGERGRENEVNISECYIQEARSDHTLSHKNMSHVKRRENDTLGS